MGKILTGLAAFCLASCGDAGTLQGTAATQQPLESDTTAGDIRIGDATFAVRDAVYGQADDGRPLLVLSDEEKLCEELTQGAEQAPGWAGRIALDAASPGTYTLMNPRNPENAPTAAARLTYHAHCDGPVAALDGWLGSVTVANVSAASITGSLEFFVRDARSGRASGNIRAQFKATYCPAVDGTGLAAEKAQRCSSRLGS